jgi:hypothetical protein
MPAINKKKLNKLKIKFRLSKSNAKRKKRWKRKRKKKEREAPVKAVNGKENIENNPSNASQRK